MPQNIVLGSVAAGFALLLAAMGFMITEIQGVSDDLESMEQRIIAQMRESDSRIMSQVNRGDDVLGVRIDSIDGKITDTRERVIRIEERLNATSGGVDRN